MTKAEDRRTVLLDCLADHVLAHGLSASSLRPLAKAAGTSDRMLLYYFPDKGALIGAVLEVVAARMVVLLDARRAAGPLPYAELKRQLLAIVFADDLWPYMRLWLEMASLAALGDPVFRAVGEQLGRGFLAWGAAQLDSADETAREVEAAQLLVAIEGTLLLRSVGLGDVAARAV
ncbi:TetR/AcrR family transcriptional regulator [Sphingomonas sp. SUN039]|uniref:TetR/AcrR family transcriptional regulator n=1 Tax=Sphingomonas sp. SUN039 TaxID=2937787 RepID=UPI0021643B1D|nr:TetR/AcrR family transcriptional regulator [Sphingomonas sp. SUN039]UVO54693.1 TetR/AcrR family transcriptional regulator [Sphingomonas sp. SUN039]